MDELFALLKERNLEIINYYKGHINKVGKYTGQESNPYCLVRDDREPVEKVFYAMLCRPSKIVYISIDDINKVLLKPDGSCKETWYYEKNKDSVISSKNANIINSRFIHSVIKEVDKKKFVVHFNKNKLDNRKSNLRYKTIIFRNLKNLPSYFYDWYNLNRNIYQRLTHCLYVIEKDINKHYFIIDNKHPVLQKKNITYEISSSKDDMGPINLIEKYLQIERALNFIAVKGTEWTFDELITIMYS